MLHDVADCVKRWLGDDADGTAVYSCGGRRTAPQHTVSSPTHRTAPHRQPSNEHERGMSAAPKHQD
eukprot:6576720-Prymnesium_polylepis.1